MVYVYLYIILKITICFGTFLFVNNYFKKIPALFIISFTFCDFNSFWIFWQHRYSILNSLQLYFIDKYLRITKFNIYLHYLFTLFALTGVFSDVSNICIAQVLLIFKLFTKKKKKLINFKIIFYFFNSLFICAGFIGV